MDVKQINPLAPTRLRSPDCEAPGYTKDALPAPKVRSSRSTLNYVNTFSFHSLVVSSIDTTFSELLTDVTDKSQKNPIFWPYTLELQSDRFQPVLCSLKCISSPAQKSTLFMNNNNWLQDSHYVCVTFRVDTVASND
jgi:hypothetical protein